MPRESLAAHRARDRAERGLPAGQEIIVGSIPDGRVAIVENGLTYQVDLRAGQKTGFYLDQRLNRQAAAGYCRGREVLDLFCFTGGFSLNARQQRRSEFARASTALPPRSSGLANTPRSTASTAAQFESGDVLRSPRAPAQRRKALRRRHLRPAQVCATGERRRTGAQGLLRSSTWPPSSVLEPDGVLVTCSCSGLVGRELFADVIASVAEQSGRPIQILEQRGQAPDHPISASCLETEYLKCMICRVGGW